MEHTHQALEAIKQAQFAELGPETLELIFDHMKEFDVELRALFVANGLTTAHAETLAHTLPRTLLLYHQLAGSTLTSDYRDELLHAIRLILSEDEIAHYAKIVTARISEMTIGIAGEIQYLQMEA